jgi:hypothetical protein
MRKLIFILILIITNINSFSQDVVGSRVIAKQSFYLRDRWVDSIRIDTVGLSGDNGSLMTAGAIYKFVSNRSGGGAGSGTVTSVTGTADRITITGTPTVNPTVNIAATYVGQTSITTLGTITTGVWNGTAIANANLANSSLTIGSTSISLGATSTTLAGLTSVTSTTFIGALTGNASTATNVALGGITGLGTGVATALAINVGSAGAFVTFNGAGGTPSAITLTNGTGLPDGGLSLTDVTTNNTSTSAHGFFPKLTANTVYYVSNAGALTALALGSSGQVLQSNGATSAPTFETPAGGASWNSITNPTADQALTFDAGESSTWTDANTTEDLFTVNSSTGTTNSIFSLNRTGTALAAGNNIMELVSSGANGTGTITSTALRISNTNTGTTSTNVGLNVITSGATNNYAILAQGYIGISTPTVGAFTPTASIEIKDADAGVTSFQVTGTDGQFRLKIREYGSYIETFSSVAQVYNSYSAGRLNLGGYNVGDQLAMFGTYITVKNRFNLAQGSDVASAAGAIALGTGGNSFEITGTDAITLISNATWQNGSIVTLLFTSTATLTDGTAHSGTDIGMELAGNTNFVASAGATLTLILSEIGGTQRWREMARSVQ